MSHPDGSGVGKERMNPARGHPGGAGEEEEGDSVAPRLAIWPPRLPASSGGAGRALAAAPSPNLSTSRIAFLPEL